MRLEMRFAIWNFSTFSNPSWELLIWNFQMRLETKYAIWNVWNLKLFKHVMGVAYLKLSDETWKRGAIWNFLALETFKTFQTHHVGLLIWNFQMRLEMRCAIWNFSTFSNPSWELLIWNFQMRLEKEVLFETFWHLKLLKRFKPIMWGCLFETFKWDLKWDLLFETFQPFRTHHGSCLFETFRWDLKQDMLFEMFETWNFSNMSWELLIWNFQMRLETKYAIWNVWNLKLFKNVMGVVYLKLSDETWKRGAFWNFWNLKLCKPIMGGLLIWNFQMRLEMRCAIWNFSTFSNPSWELLIWNFQMRLEKEVLFETFETSNFANPSLGGLLIWNFQMRLEMRCAIWNFSTFSNPSWELLIWNFQMRLETKYAIWNVWNFKLFKHVMGVAYLKLSDETWKRGAIWNFLTLETFKTFQTHHVGLLIWNFQMRLEMRFAIWNFSTFSNPSWELLIWNFQMRLETKYAIWNVWNLKLFKHVMGVAYLKLSDETWKRGAIWNFLTLETFKTFQTHHVGLLIWNFQMRFEMRCAIWNFWNLKLCSWNYLKCLMCPLRTKEFQLSLNLAIIHMDVVSSDVWVFSNIINFVEHCQY